MPRVLVQTGLSRSRGGYSCIEMLHPISMMSDPVLLHEREAHPRMGEPDSRWKDAKNTPTQPIST
jgi:hypothetical protein